jgi:hypothetical protein
MNTNNYKKDLKKVMILYPDLEVTSSSDYQDLVHIHNLAELAFGDNLDHKLVRKAFNTRNQLTKLSSANDYFYLLFLTANSENKFRKFAYPNAPDSRDFGEPFDIRKWSELVHKIYQDYEAGQDLDSAVHKYASTLDRESREDIRFKQWFKYLLDGENKKYDLSKFSSYRFSVNPGADYGVTAPGVQHLQGQMSDLKNPEPAAGTPAINLSGIIDRFNTDPSQPVQAPQPAPPSNPEADQESAAKDAAKEENKKSYKKWKKSLDTAIRRIDKLLRSSDDYLESGVQKALAGLLHEFDQEVRDIKYHATASNLALEYANIFKKLGFEPGYEEIIKLAQEAPEAPEEAPAAAPKPPAEEGAVTPEAVKTTPEGVAPAAKEGEGEARGETPLERALSPITEAKKGEYESLAGEVDLGDAIEKLEDIAGRLSDRRTIRLLAEFDIILDKIGIAPMFPELAEAQSKLIDAYSYALTRVTKMLGMLSSGKTIFEISDVKKKELVGKTMKELNKTMENAEGEPEGGETKKSPESTQEGLEEAGLAGGAKVAPESAPAAAPAPAAEEAPKV